MREILFSHLFNLLNFFAQRQLNPGEDKAGDIIQRSGADFLMPMTRSTKVVLVLIFAGIMIVAAYVVYRIVVHIWKGEKIS